MKNPRLAGRYAKSLLDLAKEQNKVEEVYADMKLLKGLFISNKDVLALVKSPVINADKKDKILATILQPYLSPMSLLFIRLLVKKNRELNLPEISNTFIDQYNTLKNIHKVKLTTAIEVSEAIKNEFVNRVKQTTNVSSIELETVIEPDLIGGFTLEMGDQLVDASILRDLNDVRKQFADNEYIHKLR
ncbi:MAG: ATP synthase F1 subunit delta [Ferruginibacter sp.]